MISLQQIQNSHREENRKSRKINLKKCAKTEVALRFIWKRLPLKDLEFFSIALHLATKASTSTCCWLADHQRFLHQLTRTQKIRFPKSRNPDITFIVVNIVLACIILSIVGMLLHPFQLVLARTGTIISIFAGGNNRRWNIVYIQIGSRCLLQGQIIATAMSSARHRGCEIIVFSA
jgi:hypothetical protein